LDYTSFGWELTTGNQKKKKNDCNFIAFPHIRVVFIFYFYPMTTNIFTILGLENEEIEDKKQCLYCKEEKYLYDFPKHSHYKDNLDSRCKECIKKHNKLREQLHKKAPARPSACECCGEIPYKWCLDHDHQTNEFRGWLCDKCNTGIGKLGDNLDGLHKAVIYLQKFYKNG
jgi:hypothetical protein